MMTFFQKPLFFSKNLSNKLWYCYRLLYVFQIFQTYFTITIKTPIFWQICLTFSILFCKCIHNISICSAILNWLYFAVINRLFIICHLICHFLMLLHTCFVTVLIFQPVNFLPAKYDQPWRPPFLFIFQKPYFQTIFLLKSKIIFSSHFPTQNNIVLSSLYYQNNCKIVKKCYTDLMFMSV